MDNGMIEQECAVCLQKCHHPTQLPCGHIFCFLCVKGIAFQSRKCAMCRGEIPHDYLNNPVLLEKLLPQQENVEEPQLENQWYYEGRSGWWKYDERSNIELETAFVSGEAHCTLLLAGALYSIDFQTMIQVRSSDRTRRRRVRRDTPLFPAKGVAGIKGPEIQVVDQQKSTASNDNTNPVDNIQVESSDEEVQFVQVVEPVIIEIDTDNRDVEEVTADCP